MASIHQVRGVLLEEAVLMLLRAAGYRTVTSAQGDPSLGTSSAGLTVAGRGAWHQIDAIADLRVGQPFTYPQRLLVEAKSYADHRTIGLPIVRGTVGVLKDVSEYWVAQAPGRPPSGRYHYQGAIFSSSSFTKDAQDYAFAHDIHLLPLAGSSYFAPVLAAVNTAAASLQTENGQAAEVNLSLLRQVLRSRLQPDINAEPLADTYQWIDPIVTASHQVGRSLIATLGHAFSVFLTPNPTLDLSTLSPIEMVEIHFADAAVHTGWTITKTDGTLLFTFDLPPRLFELYADEGVLSRRDAKALKAAYFGEFTALYAEGPSIKLFNFQLDPGWLARVRERVPQVQE